MIDTDKFIDKYVMYEGKNPSQEEIIRAKKALHWFMLLENEPRDQLGYVIEDFFKLDRIIQETALLMIRGALESDMEEGIRRKHKIEKM